MAKGRPRSVAMEATVSAIADAGHAHIAGLGGVNAMQQMLIPAAQYLRMSTEHQQYSIDNQEVAIRHYASENGFLVVRSYRDAGRSGLILKERDGLIRLLSDVARGEQSFKAILVYDISRWGRFQDADEAAYYEFICKKAGYPVHYCAELFHNDNAMPNVIMKALKRVMASEYSRELSHKVFDAEKAMVKRGFWMGSQPGYGLQRILYSASGEPKQILKAGERKNIKEDRTRLIPGPPEEVAWVREIYRMFVEEKKSSVYIAKFLNAKGITKRGTCWDNQSVLKILKHEKYTGSLVWGRWTQTLRTRSVPVPRERWTMVPNVFDPIVDRKTFDKAQQTLRDLFPHHFSDKQLISKLRPLLARKQKLCAKIINQCRYVPSADYYIKRFGSLKRLYALVGYKRRTTNQTREKTRRRVTELHEEMVRRLTKLFGGRFKVVRDRKKVRPRILRFSNGLRLSIVICLAEQTVLGDKRWIFQSCSAKRHGFMTLLCRCNPANTRVRDFYLMPTVANLTICALLKDGDTRLSSGRKLRGLGELPRIMSHLIGPDPKMERT
jgi:DNA invertase Pin-like site-specific DNA recombinase